MTLSISIPVRILVISDDADRVNQLKFEANNSTLNEIEETNVDSIFDEILRANLPLLVLIETSNSLEKYTDLFLKIQQVCEPSKVMVVACFKSKYLPDYAEFIASGIFDYALMPVAHENMVARLTFAKERLLREDKFSQMGRLDALTGVLTRQGYLERARALYASAKRKQISTAILMLSVDRLNGINLRFGQETSDKVLTGFADILTKRKRDTDLLCRFSDNSFCMMTVNMRLSHLETFLDDIVLACLSPQYKAGLITLHVNASIGLTTNLGHDFDDMLSKAESALQQSRDRGPNEVTIDNEIKTTPVPIRSIIS